MHVAAESDDCLPWTTKDLRRDPNQLWVTHWTGTLNAPGMSGFGNAEKVPLADPVLVTFLISNNFRNKGLDSGKGSVARLMRI